MDDAAIVIVLLELTEERGFGKHFCPSEAVRRLKPDNWREMMDDMRHVARGLDLGATLGGNQLTP